MLIHEAERNAGSMQVLLRNFCADLDFAIAIRTMILKNKKAYAGRSRMLDSIAEMNNKKPSIRQNR